MMAAERDLLEVHDGICIAIEPHIRSADESTSCIRSIVYSLVEPPGDRWRKSGVMMVRSITLHL